MSGTFQFIGRESGISELRNVTASFGSEQNLIADDDEATGSYTSRIGYVFGFDSNPEAGNINLTSRFNDETLDPSVALDFKLNW